MKLFVTDYDGTFFIDNVSINENIKMLKKLHENDFKIMISTGRSYPSIKNQMNIYNIPYDYLSCADGSILYDNNDNILEMYLMDNKIIQPFKDFYQNLNYEEIQFSYPTGYSNILSNNDNRLLGINVCISTLNYTKEIVDSFLEMKIKYPKYHFLNYMHPNFSYLCIKPDGIDKSSTITYLKNKYNIKLENIYVIGDSYNDYEMIKKYYGSCMDTSCNDVLNIAKKKYHSVSDYIKDILKED